MSLFGKILDNIKSAATSDTGTFLLQGTQGLDRKRSQALTRQEQTRLENARNQYLQSIDQAYAPQYPQATSIDPSLSGYPDQPESPPQQDPIAALVPAILRAQGQGLDVGNPQTLMKMGMPDYETINGGDGSYGIVDKRSGKVTPGQLPNQYMELIAKLKEAQVRAAEALAAQRQSASGLNTAKTKAGGFAPRQPRAGPKILPPLPPGFVVSQ